MAEARLGVAWRYATLAGAAVGLAAAGLAPAPAPVPLCALLALALALARPRRSGVAAWAWLALVAACAALAGIAAGEARLRALDSGAATIAAGTQVRAAGTVASVPRIGSRATRFGLETPQGRVGVELGSRPPAGLVLGAGARVVGVARDPEAWERALWRRHGATSVVRARELRLTAARRGGLAGFLDGVRDRARAALGQGTPEPTAALLRGFVLGEDDRIAAAVREEFRRSGLAHILAVSGQNVMLLAALALPVLALLGVGARARLGWVVALIAIYVPVAGAAPSIQRAGVMGIAGAVAVLAGRPAAGWYALLLAAAATLALDPRAAAEIGWQLSFAAVAGLFLVARPLAAALGATGRPAGSLRRLLAEGAAITTAAALATAPLIAHHFGVASLTTLPANLLALPAVAPAMWLGMAAGALGQVGGAPVEPLVALGGLCAGYVGWVAQALGPAAAQVAVPPPGTAATLALTGGLLALARLACAAAARRRRLAIRAAPLILGLALVALAPLAAVAALAPESGERNGPVPGDGIELRFLDVGQGDAVLIRQPGDDPALVDTGPPGALLPKLAELGVGRLAAVILTHDDLDHSGGLAALLAEHDVGRIVTAPGRTPAVCRAPLACPPISRARAGDVLRAGRLRIEVLWPRARPGRGAEPNESSLVLALRYGEFDALLAGDAEAESSPYRAGPVEVLKVAHHGSADAGLPRLLAASDPAVAVISVGDANPYGHPDPGTLAALAASGATTLRTDRDGDVVVRAGDDGWAVE